MKICYFGYSVRGAHSMADNYYMVIRDAIRSAGFVPGLEAETIERLPNEDVDSYFARRDLYWLDHSVAMIAEVSNAATGMGIELAYANWVVKIPILCVKMKDSPSSAMIRSVGFKTEPFSYRGQADLEDAVKRFLEDL